MRNVARKIAFALLTAVAVGGAFAIRAAAEPNLEYRVKAAFLYNFAKFVAWPAEVFPAADSPVAFCLAGDDPFGELLESIINERKVEGRSISIRRLASDAPLAGCHLVFSSELDGARVARVLQHAGEANALTVGEADDFLSRGGMIRLFVEEGKVRFDISARSAEQVGLKISSQLLKLARNVER
jgi:hypothetical protein